VEGVEEEVVVEENEYLQQLNEMEDKKYKIRVTDKKTGNTYVRMATRAKISELRANPNISSVEMTQYGDVSKTEKLKGAATAKTKSGKYSARNKQSKKLDYFDTPKAQRDAVKAGTHTDPEAKTKTNEPVAGSSMYDKDYAKDRGGQTDKKSTAPSGKLPKKMEEDDIFFSKDAVERKATEADTKVDSLPIGAKEKAIIKGVIRKVLKGLCI
ncbi:MAG: Synechococcus phage, partial [Pseudomonadota bacterium]